MYKTLQCDIGLEGMKDTQRMAEAEHSEKPEEDIGEGAASTAVDALEAKLRLWHHVAGPSPGKGEAQLSHRPQH